MDIGKRLHGLRHAKGLTQSDIQKRTGITQAYTSAVENGHTIPSLETLEKYAKALDVELYQLFFAGKGKPEAPRVAAETPPSPDEQALLKLLDRMTKPDRRLLLDMARKMATARK